MKELKTDVDWYKIENKIERRDTIPRWIIGIVFLICVIAIWMAIYWGVLKVV